MEGLYLLKEILEEGDYLCKMLFCVCTLEKFVRFQWKGTLYKFLEHVIMDSDTTTQ